MILRLALGVMMLLHGIAKLQHGVDGLQGLLTQFSIPVFFAYGVYLGEVVAPIMLIIGYRTRIASLLFISTMIVAILTAHSSDIASLTKSGGWAIELPALYLFGALSLFFTGGGNRALSTGNKWD
ncbi:DoxX family protein [Marinigracilibium pacificum]|uniref:DoxX family protein n=1 Tax=Marinigracilibium pacificum TaxID=2729599 RepID=UPI00232A56C6|nr:DoxX family protein [Marinigracilibium pacificum]